MFDRLRTLARLLLMRWSGPFPPPPGDPRIGVREPRVRRPSGRSSEVAVDEPPEWQRVDARADRASTPTASCR
jgi:hypothetical protein